MLAECITVKVPQIAGIIFTVGFIGILIVAGINLYKSGDDD